MKYRIKLPCGALLIIATLITRTEDAKAPAAETYVVQRGDTLWALADRWYGDATQWPMLAAQIGCVDPARLMPGTVLQVPQ